MTAPHLALEQMIRKELAQPVPPGAQALADCLRARYGTTLRAVLMYGSNLRQGDDHEGVLDLYVLVEDYRSAYESQPLAVLNRLLPPNVFYLETRAGDRMVRAKYAVLAQRDLARLTSTMNRQVLGISPYWGVGPGRLRFSSLSYAPRRLPRAIVPLLLGRPSVHLRPELGYRSVNADEVCLTFDSGYTLDGELFEPSNSTARLTLSARQHAYFLRERP